MSAAMTDIAARRPPRDARVYGVVHEDNVKSLALCRRHGLVYELDRSERGYIRLVTEHRARTP
jgi:RimJ/RimL family protein N-acetyltransferase